MLFIYSGSYGIKIILSFRLLDYESVCFLNFLRIQLIGLLDTLLYLAYRGNSGILLLNFVNSTFTSSTMGGRRTHNRKANAMEQENDASNVEGDDHPIPPTSHSTAGEVSDGIN